MNDLKQAIRVATKELRDELVSLAKQNLSSIPFKDNIVRMAGGGITSDEERKSAVMESIIAGRLQWIERKTLSYGVSALDKNFPDAHIGLYYEYGTGTEVDVEADFPGWGKNWNPFRLPIAGAPIVSRSKFTNGGFWEDLGGNLRQTKSPRGGTRNASFVRNIGADTKAYHWFSDAFNTIRAKANARYLKAFRTVPLDKYFIVKKKVVLGKEKKSWWA